MAHMQSEPHHFTLAENASCSVTPKICQNIYVSLPPDVLHETSKIVRQTSKIVRQMKWKGKVKKHTRPKRVQGIAEYKCITEEHCHLVGSSMDVIRQGLYL
jgi:hypothetical protein